MIKGLKYWNDSSRYCDQTNNVIEKARKDVDGKIHLESCNVESIYTGMDARGDLEIYGNPTWQGIDCTPAHFMFGHINWTKYDNVYQSGSAMDNEYIYSLEKMLRKMGYQTEISKNPSPSFFKARLKGNKPIVINIPGHYCCAIAWDYLNGELIYHNPWPGDKRNKNKGRFERIKVSEWIKIPIKYGLAFWK